MKLFLQRFLPFLLLIFTGLGQITSQTKAEFSTIEDNLHRESAKSESLAAQKNKPYKLLAVDNPKAKVPLNLLEQLHIPDEKGDRYEL